MEEEVSYFAIVGVGRTPGNPSGLARRRYSSEGRVDESLQRDLSWRPTDAVTQWEYGNSSSELTEISEAAAQGLIDRFRAEWGGAG
jgi:hypothetical protein